MIGRLRHPSAVVFGLALAACYTAPQPRTVQRVDPKSTVDLSGEWNDADANRVAQSMIKDMLTRPWAERFRQENGRDPVVKLYPVRNRTEDHIETKFFTKQVEREMINSGRIQVVAASDETGAARAERVDQSYHASDATKKEHQQETGTDFLLNGWIVTQTDRAGGQTVRAYVVTMELINAESQRKVWLNTTPIKKIVNQEEYQW
jgi:PBP1b-binding outer membrane lipoprotein LpoB